MFEEINEYQPSNSVEKISANSSDAQEEIDANVPSGVEGQEVSDSSCNAGSHNIELGTRGENAACAFLERKGFTILDRNWRCTAGEADIIAVLDTEWGSELHFIEVKTRMSTASGFPEEAVGPEKRRKYEVISEIYLQRHKCEEARVTFDIISILVTAPDRAFLRMHCNVLGSDCV